MALSDYTFRFGEEGIGVVLNDDYSFPIVGRPLYDVDGVEGLDLSNMRSSSKESEGTNGGTVDAAYLGIRTVTMRGTLYAHQDDSLEKYIDSLKKNFEPQPVEQYLYLKAPGVDERRMGAKAVSFQAPWTVTRRFNSTPFQVIFQGEDPLFYEPEEQITLANLNQEVISYNRGNSPIGGVLTINGPATNPKFWHISTGLMLTFVITLVAGEKLLVDFNHNKRTVKKLAGDGVTITQQRKTVLNETQWFLFGPGANTWKITTDSGAATGSLAYRSGWY